MGRKRWVEPRELAVVRRRLEACRKDTPFPKPRFAFEYQVEEEIEFLRRYLDVEPGRQIPAKSANRLLVATWNIANLGLQQRRDDDYQLLAEVISWFDTVAIQEVGDSLSMVFEAFRLSFLTPGGLSSAIEQETTNVSPHSCSRVSRWIFRSR